LRGILAADPVMGWRLFFTDKSGESSLVMEIDIYVGNLSKSTTQEHLNVLFSQAGDVTSVNLIKDNKSGESNGYAFVTMSAQSEADKAVSMFNTYPLDDQFLKVILLRPRQQRGFDKI
jgi:cold-inducible RNA-binding protein